LAHNLTLHLLSALLPAAPDLSEVELKRLSLTTHAVFTHSLTPLPDFFFHVLSDLLQAAPDLSEVELKRLFTALDVDNTGSVDAQEFFAGVLQVALQPHQTHTLLEASFKSLDRWVAGCLSLCCLGHAWYACTPLLGIV
jgi:hypothetical protein